MHVLNVLNMFLSTIGSEINTELKQTNHAVGTSSLLNRTGFKFEPVTEMSVINTMHNLKNNKKGGKSQISTYIYKLLCPYIVTKLTHLINKIISTNIFPVIWKEALVTPIPKPGARTNPSNYRPISSLPILSKLTEKIIAQQIRHYTESNSLIAKQQFGFRENHSTQTLLLQLTNKWLRALDHAPNTYVVCLTALDIKKAFDTIDHDTLLYKLANIFKFHPSSIKLISSYLSDRIQCVKVNNTISNPLPVKAGVPQGSVLGPILFNMFINDITNIGSCYLFADDCIIEHVSETAENAILLTNRSISQYTDWYKSNLLQLNSNKTTVLLLSNRHTTAEGLQPVLVNEHAVAFSDSIKYLGLTLDQSLNWNSHITNIKHKVMPIVWNFARIRNLLDSHTARTYYTSLIRPLLEYASAVQYNMSQTNNQILETIQNRCLRIITKCHPYTPSAVIRKQLNLPSLNQRRTYFFLCEFYKLYNNISDNITVNFIVRAHTQPRSSLRHANNVFIPSMNKSVGQRALCYLGPKTFNDLPKQIKASPSFQIFKNQLKSHLLKSPN